jgi:hypothetical protein
MIGCSDCIYSTPLKIMSQKMLLRYLLFSLYVCLPRVFCAVHNDAITYEDLVKSLYLSRVGNPSIGCGKNDIPPEDYIELVTKRIVNLRPIYKEFCKSLKSKEIWDQKMKEFGKEIFEQIVDGECLTLGALNLDDC